MVAGKFAIIALSLASTLGAIAAEDTMTGVFNDRIHSLQVHPAGDEFGFPVVMLEGDDVLEVSFDHLSDDREFFRYSLTHCNRNWQPSGLVESEYLDGFNEGTIDDYEFSQATTVHYVHYRFEIPGHDMRPKLSGNYLLRVYPESDPDSTVFQCRFMVSEQTAPVSVQVSGITDIDYRKEHQQLTVSVDTERALVEDPFNELTVVVGQNGRLDSEVAVSHPVRMLGRTAVFEHTPELIFEGGNEYRRFETVNERYPGMGIADIDYFYPYYHYTLAADGVRAGEPYAYDQTQAGRYFVRRSDSNSSETEADYGVVHFVLEADLMPGAMVFIDGDFVQRRFDANSRMVYNASRGRYERSMLLKQGAYNYQYLVVPPGARRGYTAPVEGDYYQTANEYFVRVYHRRRGERYDRLIGVGAAAGL